MLNGNIKFKLLIGLGSLVTAIAVWTLLSNSHKDIPTIYPNNKSFKIKPENQLGHLSSNIDRDVYDSFGKSAKISDVKKAINLLPEPEQPISIAEPPKNQDVFNVIGEESEVPELFTPVPAEEANSKIPNNIPRTAKTAAIVTKEQGEDSIWDNIEEALGENDGNIQKEVAEATPVEALNKEDTNSLAPEMKILKITNLDSDKSQEKKKKASILKKEVYRSQIAYKRTINEAEHEWKKLFSLHKKLLEKYKYEIIKDQKSKAVFYQLVVGKFNSFSEAKQLCRKLINNKMTCIVVKE